MRKFDLMAVWWHIAANTHKLKVYATRGSRVWATKVCAENEDHTRKLNCPGVNSKLACQE